MKQLIHMAAALAAAMLLLAGANLRARALQPPELSAQSAILIDAGTGRVLFAQSPDRQSKVASTTKIMTGLLVCERCDLAAEFEIPAEAVGVEGSSMYLKAGETYTIRELLYGLMLQSGNDAAQALAICAAGSVEAFVSDMNERAAALGLVNTHFANPSGLDQEGHVSTARDLAMLARTAMENETFREIVSTRSFVIGNRVLTNHNKLLWYYDGAIGVKTGYTSSAGRVLVSCAQRDGRRLIAVTIRDRDDWNDHKALLDYGFTGYDWRTTLRAGEAVGTVPVVGGADSEVELVVWDAVRLPLRPEERLEVRLFAPNFVYAPVLTGQAGYAEFWCGGERLASVPLYYREPVAENIEKKSGFSRFFGG